jgi:hypothetical protein
MAPMIVTRIDGGLGNQMFQYAFGLYLALKHQAPLALDLSAYQAGPQHGYMLDRFQISAAPVNAESSQRIPKRYRKAPTTWMPDWLRPAVLARVKERPFGFHEKYLQSPDNSYLVGYWQSEKFFPGLRESLIEHFSLAVPISDRSQRVLERIQASNSISLHIRRGDYVNSAETARIYEQLSLEYYQRQLQRFADQHERVQVFVFSNDLAWCRQNLRLHWPIQFVDHNCAQTAYEDLIMMSHAACNVIANSTFSWWAGYLNQRAQHSVFAPAQWFRPNTLDGTHIPCTTWQIADVTPPQAQRAA